MQFRRTDVFRLIVCLFLSGAATSSAEKSGSPYRIAPTRETAIVITGGALSISGIAAESNVSPPGSKPLHRSDVPGFDRVALGLHSDAADLTSNIGEYLCAALPVIAATRIAPSRGDMRTIIIMYAESALLVQGTLFIAKGTTHRIRPFAYDQNVTLSKLNDRDTALSFWSGHAAIAFNSAVFTGTVFQTYHPDSRFVKPVWALGLTTAAVTCVLRVRAGQHFPSDVIAGATAGSLTGWLVPRLHRTCAGNSPSIEITPALNGPPGITLHRSF